MPVPIQSTRDGAERAGRAATNMIPFVRDLLPDGGDDPELRAAAKRLALAWLLRESEKFTEMRTELFYTNWIGRIIFLVVHAVLLIGLVMSWQEFRHATQQRHQAQQEPDFLGLFDNAPHTEVLVYGMFSGGVKRDISSPSFGTVYEIADSKVATVDAEGLITAVGPGQTTRTVKNCTLSVTVPVYVKLEPPPRPPSNRDSAEG